MKEFWLLLLMVMVFNMIYMAMVMMSEKVVVKDEVLEAGVDNFGFEHVKL